MGLLSFNPEYRRIWMFPRNIRYIAPWKIYGILKVLMQCDDDKSDEKAMYKLLAATGIKRKENVRDKNDGGMRTYFAQLEMLGLVYETENSNKYHYTIAGDAIANEDNPLQVLQYQLLRHQYPSAYGLSPNVKMDPRMKVKPFLFIIRLLHDDRLDRKLTNEDVIIPVVYGHNDDCYEFVVEKIIKGRQSKNGVAGVIDNPNIDMYTRRGNPGKAFDNMKDIANTALNYLEATQLVLKNKNEKGRNEYVFNEYYENIYQKLLLEKDIFIQIESKKEVQSFQRSYGRYLKEKDTRKESEIQEKKESPSIQFATYKYVEFLNDNLFVYDTSRFISEMDSFGISLQDTTTVIDRLSNKKNQLWENTYLDYAFSGGLYSSQFEQATVELLISIGFDESEWTGRRKSYDNWRGNFPDVFIKRKGTVECGLGEVKATSSFSLGHSDMLKMKDTYVYTNNEIYKGSKLIYFIYIAGGFKGDIDRSLSMLSEATGVPVSAIDAKGMLKIKERNLGRDIIEKEIFQSKRFISSGEIGLL